MNKIISTRCVFYKLSLLWYTGFCVKLRPLYSSFIKLMTLCKVDIAQAIIIIVNDVHNHLQPPVAEVVNP